MRHANYRNPYSARFEDLLSWRCLAATHLFSLQILIEQEQRSLVCLGGSHDGKHSLASLVMGSLCCPVSKTKPLLLSGYQDEGARSCYEFRNSLRTLAIEMRAPDVLRISLILLPARPMMHPTMSAGMLMFCV